MKERKELYCGSTRDCAEWISIQPDAERLEIVHNDPPGPAASVFWKRKAAPVIARPIRRLTRETFRVQGVKANHERPLWVSLEPGDVITFCPQGTSQRISVPIASAYASARFSAARAIALARRKERKSKR